MLEQAASPLAKVQACLALSREARQLSKTSLVGLPGDVCLKVVERERGGTTAKEFHCSGSCPTCNAFVAKCRSFSRYPLILCFWHLVQPPLSSFSPRAWTGQMECLR